MPDAWAAPSRWHAASLAERLAWTLGDGRAAVFAQAASTADPEGAARLARWRELLGGRDGWAQRVRGLGASFPEAVWSVVLGNTPPAWAAVEPDRLPAWASWPERLDAMLAVSAPSHQSSADPSVRVAIDTLLARFEPWLLSHTPRRLHEAQLAYWRPVATALAAEAIDLEARRLAMASDPAAALTGGRGPSPSPTSRVAWHQAYARALDGAALPALLQQYPVLARGLTDSVTSAVTVMQELEHRLSTDAAVLWQRFSADIAQLRAVEPSLGDAHEHGRVVMRLHFGNGVRVLYKPRALAAEVALASLVRAWQIVGGAPLVVPDAVDRGTYGWMAHVDEAPCATRAAATSYHERLGEWMALAWCFGGADLHNENILAVGAQPVPIDSETFPQPAPPAWGGTRPDAALEDSVLRTGVLPVWLPGMGGLSRAPTAWFGSGRVPPEDDAEALQRGFTDALARLGRWNPGATPDPLARATEALHAGEARVLYRPTEAYARLLRVAARPAALRHGVDRSLRFERLAARGLTPALGGDATPFALIDAEIAALERGDVPRFTVAARDTAWRADGRPLPGCHAGASAAAMIVTRRREAQQAGARHWQARALAAALGARTPLAIPAPAPAPAATATPAFDQQPHGDAADDDSTRTVLRAEAARLITALVSSFGADPAAPALGLHREADSALMRVYVVDDSWYRGRLGVALAVQAAHATPAPVIDRLLAPVVAPTPSMPSRLADGVAGWVYTMTRLAVASGTARWLDAARAGAQVLAHADQRARAADGALDVLDGAAGVILSLLALQRVAPQDEVLDTALSYAAPLLHRRVQSRHGLRAWDTLGSPEPATGLSHGAAGIALALAQLAAHTGDAVCQDAADEAIAYETASFDATRRNWPDYRGVRAATDTPGWQATWCHGAAGIGHARLAMPAPLAYRADIHAAVDGARQVPLTDADHVCCGSMGRLDLLLSAAPVLGDPALVRDARARARALVARAHERGTYALYAGVPGEHFSPGFFHGTAGIAYTLARLADPEQHAAVLQLA